MKRLELPEIEDLARLPAWLRNAMTGYLQVAIAVGRPYAVVTPALADLIRKSGSQQIVDLASGGGGPWPGLVEDLAVHLDRCPSVTLTDIQPNQAAAVELERLPGVSYCREPVSALEIPSELHGIRTMFTGLHHFGSAEVRSILQSAQRAGVPFLAAEATHRSAKGLLITLLVPLMVLLLMPRVRPRRLLPLLLTYLPPLLPLLIWWDGVASTLKSFRAEELRMLTSEIAQPAYTWRVEEVAVRGSPIPVTIVVGRPVNAAA